MGFRTIARKQFRRLFRPLFTVRASVEPGYFAAMKCTTTAETHSTQREDYI